jgi:hypothetical protein
LTSLINSVINLAPVFKSGTVKHKSVPSPVYYGWIISFGYVIQDYYKRNRHFQRYAVSKPFSVVDT